MSYTVLIPARLGSTRLPDKPLLDLAGLPMIVRVAKRAALSAAKRVVVAADDQRIARACEAHGIEVVLTDADHATGSDRLAQACAMLDLDGHDRVVNVQGDEPLIDPALIDACATLLETATDCVMSTAAHPIQSQAEFVDPNVVKVVTDRHSHALYFSRAPIPWWRDGKGQLPAADDCPVWRHIGIYGYRAGFLRAFPSLLVSPLERVESLEQLRVLWHGQCIAVHRASSAPGMGVDTPEDLARVRALLAAAH